MNIATLNTDFGVLGVCEQDGYVVELMWNAKKSGDITRTLQSAISQLQEYSNGQRQSFDLPLNPKGTEFQLKVYQEMLNIPYGEVRSYGDIAKNLGASAQAVGNACGSNLIPIIIPCHRVVGVNGLGGFSGAGGVEMKVKLLKHEGAASLLL